MLNKLKNMVEQLTSKDRDTRQIAPEDHRLAASALLVHATLIDGELARAEHDKLLELLQARYELDPEEARELIALATREERDAVDLYTFTRRLTRELEPVERLDIIEMLWEVAYADGVLHEFEQNLIWRVAELMHVPPRERIRLKKQVKARREIS